jgi:hypothetical protein
MVMMWMMLERRSWESVRRLPDHAWILVIAEVMRAGDGDDKLS